MSRRDVLLLRAAAGWTVFVWAVFVKNQIGDDTHSVGFKAVHLTLAAISVAFAAVIWRVASKHSRRASERDRAGTAS